MGLPSNPEKPERRVVKRTARTGGLDAPYRAVFGDVSKIIDAARESAARSVNAAMTAAYWLIGRRIVDFEQSEEERAEYGAALIERLAEDLTARFGRGFSLQNIYNMHLLYLSYLPDRILQTLSGKSAPPPGRQILQTPSGEFDPPSVEVGFDDLLAAFPLPWSAYVRLLSVRNESARHFYETEALRGGWSVRQLDRQIGSRFYERTALSKNRAAMLTRGQQERPEDLALPGEQIKDPFVLEFLDLRDEYSESDLEEALVRHLETFLLELGDDFCFMGRQRRLRVGSRWYRVDLLFPQPPPKDHPWRTMANHAMTPHTSGTSLPAQARYAAGVREILECWFDGRPIRDDYLIVQSGHLAGAGAHSYSEGDTTGGSDEATRFKD